MWIGRANVEGRERVVARIDRTWFDVSVAPAGSAHSTHSITHLIATGRLRVETLQELASQGSVIPPPERFELPLVPSKVVCLGRNYAEHARELGNAVPAEPVLFNKTPNTYLADGGVIEWDAAVGRVDHEGEIALVMGREHTVAGYTLLNDVTARDLQSVDKGNGLPWYRSKNLDGFCPMGPVIRLAETVPDPLELDLEVRVNGEVRQRGNTRQFIFDVPAMIAYITQFITLSPGDLIATGTPPAAGPLAAGDQVEVLCTAIGRLISAIRVRK